MGSQPGDDWLPELLAVGAAMMLRDRLALHPPYPLDRLAFRAGPRQERHLDPIARVPMFNHTEPLSFPFSWEFLRV